MYCWFSGVLLRSHIGLAPEERHIAVIVRKGRRDVLRRCEDVGQVCSLNDPPCFLSSAAQCLAALVSKRSCYVTHVLSFGKSLGGERKSHLGHCWVMLAGSAPRGVITTTLNVSWSYHPCLAQQSTSPDGRSFILYICFSKCTTFCLLFGLFEAVHYY